MAQISLPRLEKINTVMFWESGVFFQNERWLSTKLFFVHKLLGWYVLNKNFSYYTYKWHKTNYIKLKVFKYKSLKKVKTMDRKFLVLGRYLFQFRSKNTTIILYTRQRNVKIGLTLLYQKIKKRYNNSITSKYYNKFVNNKNVTNKFCV